MSADSLAVIFKSVVLAKILYASRAWWGFANSSDKDRLEAFLRRCTQLQLYRQCDPTLNQLVEDMEDKLFTSVINNDKHVLSHIYRILIITLIISGLGDVNLHWRLKAMLETFLKDSYSKIGHYNFVFCTSFSIHCIVFFFVFIVLLRSDSGFYTLNWIELTSPWHWSSDAATEASQRSSTDILSI